MPLLEAFQKGREHPVPLIIGNNSADASVVEAFGVDPAVLVQKTGKSRILVRSLYPGVFDQSQLGREMARDALFTAFGRRIAYLHSTKAPTWRDYFNHVVLDATAGATTGVSHGGEVPFVLGTLEGCQCLGRPVTPLDRTVERRTADRWAAFVRIQRPSGKSSGPLTTVDGVRSLRSEATKQCGPALWRLDSTPSSLHLILQGAQARRTASDSPCDTRQVDAVDFI